MWDFVKTIIQRYAYTDSRCRLTGPGAATTYKDKIKGPIQQVGTSNSKTNNFMIIHCNESRYGRSRRVDGMIIGRT